VQHEGSVVKQHPSLEEAKEHINRVVGKIHRRIDDGENKWANSVLDCLDLLHLQEVEIRVSTINRVKFLKNDRSSGQEQ
jgi:hypothetical protein